MTTNRRTFIRSSAIGLAGSAIAAALPSEAFSGVKTAPAPQDLRLGIAGYTFAKFDIPTAVSMMKRVNIHELSVKDFHLPLDADAQKIKSVKEQFAAGGIKIYAVGVIYMKTKEEVDRTFAYAQRAGVPMIVGVPNYELLDYTEKVVKKTGIKLAIHNHGPEDKLYPAPEDVWKHIAKRDLRMGLCLDIGHGRRAGSDPAKAVLNYKDRIFDLHIKDVTAEGTAGKAAEVGRGIIDFPALIRALYKTRYTGLCSFEFEKDMSDSLPGLAESVGYFRGVMKTVQGTL
ncbi:MAG: sugar phosphate isomerase/epimerase [Mucilaginibacter polytrichastri]|nr:sugar phosphate isomerase/epimerase [Mucilaginibacter polytrichastri]